MPCNWTDSKHIVNDTNKSSFCGILAHSCSWVVIAHCPRLAEAGAQVLVTETSRTAGMQLSRARSEITMSTIFLPMTTAHVGLDVTSLKSGLLVCASAPLLSSLPLGFGCETCPCRSISDSTTLCVETVTEARKYDGDPRYRREEMEGGYVNCMSELRTTLRS